MNGHVRINELIPVFQDTIQDELEEGKLYISELHEVAIHLCACGCKKETATKLGSGGWNVTNVNGLVTMRPSIGNFKGENPYHAHYFITSNKIEWL